MQMSSTCPTIILSFPYLNIDMKKLILPLLVLALFASCQKPSVDLSFEELDALVSDGSASTEQLESFASMVIDRIEEISPVNDMIVVTRTYSGGKYAISDASLSFKVEPYDMAERLSYITNYISVTLFYNGSVSEAHVSTPSFDGDVYSCNIEGTSFPQSVADDGGELQYLLSIKTADNETESLKGVLSTSELNVIDGIIIDAECNVYGKISDIATGSGIAGVPVSDGYTFTVTDEHGVYQMKTNSKCRKVYYTTPAGYKVAVDASRHMPAFYNTGKVDVTKRTRYDFALEKLPAAENDFTLVMIGDPQCKSSEHANRYSGETITSLKSSLNEKQAEGKYLRPYAFTLGDITHDSYSMWMEMRTTMSNIQLQDGAYIPFFQCIGNHDHNSNVKTNDYDATQRFTDVFGPTDYSLDRGKVHIVVMDDIMVTSLKDSSTPNGQTWKYNGGFTSEQIEWLKQDLAFVKDKSDKMIVLCLHIPFRNGVTDGGADINLDKYYDTVLKMLTEFNEAHVMIGHTHYPDCRVHSAYVTRSGHPVYEHVHGAACGAWWNCDSNADGAPNGYSLYEVEGNHMKNWIAKSTKDDWGLQMRVFDGDQVYTGTKGYEYCWSRQVCYGGTDRIAAKGNDVLKGCLVADVWNDDDTYWTVEIYQDGVKKGDMTRLSPGSCCNMAIASFFFNEKNRNTGSYCDSKASHYWYFKTDTAPSEYKNWEIVATQTIPDTGEKNVYRSSHLTVDYSEF